MTDDTMHLLDVVQKSDDGDFLKAIAETACQTAFKVDPHRRPKLTPSPTRLRAAMRGAMA